MNRPQILFVDDDPFILQAFDRLLGRDFNLQLCSNLKEADAFLRQTKPEIILVDLHLKEGVSFPFFELARSLSPTSARVIISGDLSLPELVGSFEKDLIHKVMIKPWDPGNLKLQLLEALRLHEILVRNRDLEQSSSVDGLTGLLNFSAFERDLQHELQRASRKQRELSLLMGDLDNFKAINEKQGHPEGNQVLKKLAMSMKKNLRSFDLIYRYGGDEVCVILQETGENFSF